MNTNSQVEQPKPRKEEILDVATRLFAERGYEGTSMNDVAELVGMRKASLFYHFATKEALYEAVLDRLVRRLATPLGAVYAGEGSYAERLDRAADAVTAALGAWPFTARLLLREAMNWGPGARGALADKAVDVLEAAASFVRAGQDSGEFVDGDAKHLVLTALGIHFLPFAAAQLVGRYARVEPFDACFVAARRAEVRAHVRRVLVKA